VEVCGICEKDNQPSKFPILHGLKVVNQGGENNIDQL